jgi:integrase
MPRIKLNQKIVDNRLKAPDPSGRQKLWFDEAMPGFGVRCSGISPLKVYVVQRDIKDKSGRMKSRRVVIGTTEELKFEEAREEARNKIHAMRQGIDPKKVVHKGAATLNDMLELYLLTNTGLSPRSRKDYPTTIRRHLEDWMDHPLGEITPDMVATRHREIGEKIGRPTANSVMRTLRVLYNFAADRNLVPPVSPTRVLKRQWFKIAPRTRRVKADQLKTFYRAVMKLPNPIQRDYLLFVLFTGIRREQAASMTWDLIDFTAKVIRFPGNVTKGKREFNLPMTDYVHKLLDARRRLGKTDFVFTADSASGYIKEPKYPFKLIKQTTGIHWSIHDLRKTYSDALDATEMSAWALRALMHHSHPRDTTGGYLELSTDRLREPAQRACDLLKAWCGLGKQGRK